MHFAPPRHSVFSRWWVVCTFAFAIAGAPGCLRQASGPGDLGQPSTPTATFPEARDLATLPSLPPPDESVTATGVPVDAWSPAASARDSVPADDPSPWGELARTIAQGHGGLVRVTPAMRCAALEAARFHVEKRGLPTESLRRFLVAQCGASSPDSGIFVYGGDAPANVTDDAIIQKAKSIVNEQVERQLEGDAPRVLGIAAFRSKDRFAVAAVAGSDPVVFGPMGRAPEDARQIVLRGSLRSPAVDALALVNQGDFGSAACMADPAVHLPAFAFTCPLAPGDHYAWAQVLVRRAGRVLDETVADLILTDGDAAKLEYHPGPVDLAGAAAANGDFKTRLVAAVNAVRERARMPALTLAVKQSDDEGRLMGTMLDAELKHRGSDADRIALGLLAGWDVDGTIRDGRMITGFAVQGHDASAWVNFALERPLGRHVLLAPDMSRIAIGSALPKSGDGVGAVVTTYAMFESPDHAAEEQRLVQRLFDARRALRRGPLDRLEHVPALDEQSRRVLAGAVEPGAALNASMQSLAEQSAGARVSGYLVEANDVDRAPLPDVLLTAPRGKWAVAVTHHHVKGAAWGQYVIFWLLVTEPKGPSVDT